MGFASLLQWRNWNAALTHLGVEEPGFVLVLAE
jgi:hypothetical protein